MLTKQRMLHIDGKKMLDTLEIGDLTKIDNLSRDSSMR